MSPYSSSMVHTHHRWSIVLLIFDVQKLPVFRLFSDRMRRNILVFEHPKSMIAKTFLKPWFQLPLSRFSSLKPWFQPPLSRFCRPQLSQPTHNTQNVKFVFRNPQYKKTVMNTQFSYFFGPAWGGALYSSFQTPLSHFAGKKLLATARAGKIDFERRK